MNITESVAVNVKGLESSGFRISFSKKPTVSVPAKPSFEIPEGQKVVLAKVYKPEMLEGFIKSFGLSENVKIKHYEYPYYVVALTETADFNPFRKYWDDNTDIEKEVMSKIEIIKTVSRRDTARMCA